MTTKSADQGTSSSELKLGSITEIWQSRNEWLKFCQFLDNTMEPEGFDSENVPIKLSRYALFLKLYVELYHREKYLQEQRTANSQEELKKMVLNIKSHEEDFFGTERCLRCIDAGVRRQVLDNLKQVKTNKKPAGAWVYQPAYSPVLDKLNSLVAVYH